MKRSKMKRIKEAEERSDRRNKRTPEQQIALLDEKLGKGVGSKSERRRLEVMLNAAKEKKGA